VLPNGLELALCTFSDHLRDLEDDHWLPLSKAPSAVSGCLLDLETDRDTYDRGLPGLVRMDPFSIMVGVVGLADAGTSLAGFLTDKYKTYRDAPELILEIAHEVEFCAGLVDMFGSNLDRPGAEYPERFVRDAKNLVRRTNAVFLDIRGLIPIDKDFDSPFSRARWHFVLDKKKLLEHQQRLRQLQQMFMFMETMHRYHYPSNDTMKPSGGGIKDPSESPDSREQTLQGVMDSQSPMLLNGVGADGRSFQVTLTLKPVSQQSEIVPYSAPMSAPGISSRTGLSTIKPARNMQSKKRLEGLRRSPFFDMSLFEGEQPRACKAATYGYVEALPASYSRSSHSKLKAEETEARKKKTEQAQRKSDDDSQQDIVRRQIVDNDEAERDIDALSRLVMSPIVCSTFLMVLTANATVVWPWR